MPSGTRRVARRSAFLDRSPKFNVVPLFLEFANEAVVLLSM